MESPSLEEASTIDVNGIALTLCIFPRKLRFTSVEVGYTYINIHVQGPPLGCGCLEIPGLGGVGS